MRRFFPLRETRIEERVLLFLGLVERQTSHEHPTAGTPVDVPEPKTIIFIIFLGNYQIKILLEKEPVIINNNYYRAVKHQKSNLLWLFLKEIFLISIPFSERMIEVMIFLDILNL